MTSPAKSSSDFAARLEPLIDLGYRAALLWLGSPAQAEAAVEHAATAVLHLTIAGALPTRLHVVFYRLVVIACTERSARQGAMPASPGNEAGDEMAGLTRGLAGLGTISRAAMVLDLAGNLTVEDIAEVLGVPAPVARAALHIGHLQLGGPDAA